MAEFAEKQRQLLLEASSHSSCNPRLKMPRNKYDTRALKKKATAKVCRNTNAKRAGADKWKKLVGFQWAGLIGELSLSGRDNSAWNSVHAESWRKNQFPTRLKPFVGDLVLSLALRLVNRANMGFRCRVKIPTLQITLLSRACFSPKMKLHSNHNSNDNKNSMG
jgi:hypothetical protein